MALRLCATFLLLAACGRSSQFDSPPPSQVTRQSRVCESTCSSSPPGAETPLTDPGSGIPLHWLSCGDCIQVTIDSKLSSPSLALAVAAANSKWSSVLGDGLCLKLDSNPTSRNPEAKNRIHVRMADPGELGRGKSVFQA